MQAASRRKPEFKALDGKTLKRPAIEGFACLTETVFEHGDRLVFFRAGAFTGTVHAPTTKRLLFDHADARSYGSTASGLEFANTTRGLAFRMPLAGDDGCAVYDAVTSGERACVSVGVRYSDFETQTIAGYKVDVINSADLIEISLCRQGAVPETFAALVDIADEPPLWEAARSPAFATRKVVANVDARVRRITEALAGISR
ncbi:HK97 family phage prohead protease [Affinirhizobium pseudoryzae]|uniref:HK97 family phage prohead protease n=1 Tax=Allorhizobium pseudoryzae TaxID=379684 RepID=UPI0013EDBDB7|nr:HK97 family phage prohead protease [Allorhizobium pseudoryzae]